jgi:RNA polymerase sigma-70 factor (ECF subfamily)
MTPDGLRGRRIDGDDEGVISPPAGNRAAMNPDDSRLGRRHLRSVTTDGAPGPASSPLASSDLTTRSDVALVELLAARHEPALAEVYRRHASALYGLALRVLRSADHAEEVLQETVCALWERPERFDATKGDLRPWLLRMVHGKAVDRVRSEARRTAREDRDAARQPATGDDIEREVWEMVRAETVRSALETLAEGEREAIELAYFGGRTYREVATMLHLPEGTVKSRIRLGLTKLADRLAAAGLGPTSDRSTT